MHCKTKIVHPVRLVLNVREVALPVILCLPINTVVANRAYILRFGALRQERVAQGSWVQIKDWTLGCVVTDDNVVTVPGRVLEGPITIQMLAPFNDDI